MSKRIRDERFQAFNRIALHVLILLFERFPEPVDLDAKRIGLDAKPPDPTDTGEDLFSDIALAKHTLIWLRDEGFISSLPNPGISKMDLLGVRLTTKGLTVLGYGGPRWHHWRFRSFAEEGKRILAEGTRQEVVQLFRRMLAAAATLGFG